MAIILALYLLPVVILYPGNDKLRPPAEFEASIHARAAGFTAGKSNKGVNDAGLFADGRTQVDVTVHDFSAVNLSQANKLLRLPGRPGDRFRVDDATLVNIPWDLGTAVKLTWDENSPSGVDMSLEYPESYEPEVVLNAADRSSVSFSDASGQLNQLKCDRGIVTIQPTTSRKLTHKLRLNITTKRQGANPGSIASLPVETNIPLREGSAITFFDRGESSILGEDSTVIIKNADRTEKLFSGQILRIGAIAQTTLIRLQIKDGIFLHINGKATELKLDGRNLRPNLAESLRSSPFRVWGATALFISTTLITLLSQLKLINIGDKKE